MRHAQRYGIAAVDPAVDFPAVMDRVAAAIRTIEPKDSMARYSELGVNCVAGAATLEDPHHVRVGDQLISSKSIVIASGARPFVPPIPGLAEAQPLTSDNLWSLRELPGRLLVMGGGPIGCELAQAFSRLGAQVTLIDMEARLLPREDPEVSEFMAGVLREEGIDVRLGHRAVQVSAGQLHAETDSGPVQIGFDRVLVAVGRRAHTDGLGLESLGIATAANGTLVVDEYLRTAVPNIFACGDVVGPYQFTHMASHQAWYASVNAMFGRFKKFKVNYSVVPWATFTDPEIARVGLSESDALAQGIDVEVIRYDLDDLDRAIADGSTRGWVKVLVKPGSDRILGATIVGASAGELIGEFITAMSHGMGLKKIMGTIHIYPTLFEANKFAASTWRRAHTPHGLLRAVGVLQNWLR
jgi:pyruvate/2-oxoglutarate dehydrogenase complex dihydrolipoamide dehydrogenase (E3) component